MDAFADGRFWRTAGRLILKTLLPGLAWLLCFGFAWQRLDHARTMFQVPSAPAEAAAQWQRPSGNSGHAEIDFGGQWLMGRMIVEGHARELYNRNKLWEVAWLGYPMADEPPILRDFLFPEARRPDVLRQQVYRHDAENLLAWMMGSDQDSPRRQELGPIIALPFAMDAGLGSAFPAGLLTMLAGEQLSPELIAAVNTKVIGGPLYPPIHGFFYAPLACLEPARAYAVFQHLMVALTFIAGYAFKVLSRGQLWWSLSSLAIFVYPGYRAGLDLAQNPVLTLTILAVGWALLVRDRPLLGGMVWGLLAFKPVWAASFFLVPLLMGRWRFCLGMIGTGLALILLTLPFTGVQVWFDWWTVGQQAAELYQVNQNWIELSRDLHGIPRRLWLDFSVHPEAERLNRPEAWRAAVAGWMLVGSVLLTTIAVYYWKGDRRRPTGLGAGLLFLAAWLCCYRFMYYDTLLSILAFAVMLSEPRFRFQTATFTIQWCRNPGVWPLDPMPWPEPLRTGLPRLGPCSVIYFNSIPLTVLAVLILGENWLLVLQPEATLIVPAVRWVEVNPLGGETTRVARVAGQINYYHPWDTLVILGFWCWAVGYRFVYGDNSSP
jgi:arabinofuranan 3-O-arabinosyltransferase